MTQATAASQTFARFFGACLLIAGTSIGAAMLALPISTGRAGLVPSLIVMGSVWLYLLYAAFYILEVQLVMPKESNLISMADRMLGKGGKIFSWAAYLFLLYALNTAYLCGLSSLVQSVLSQCGWEVSELMCMVPILAFFALLQTKGTHYIDVMNRIFMTGLVGSFCLLVFYSMPYVKSENLAGCNVAYVLPSLAVCLCAFGYHIVIPSLATYLEGNVTIIKRAILLGSAVPLVVYVIWQIVTLGMIGQESLFEAHEFGITSTKLLLNISKNRQVLFLDQSIGFFVMITSFLGVCMSLFDFLKDGFKGIEQNVPKATIFLFAFAPPVYFALFNQRIFLTALEYAGAFGVVILLALIPALMVWQKRYVHKEPSSFQAPGGKITLAGFIAVSAFLIIMQCVL